MGEHEHSAPTTPDPPPADLGTTEPTALPPKRTSIDAKWSDGVKSLSTSLPVLGLLLYVILWLGYATFYNRFGLSPRDLGFGYLDILVQSAVAIVIVLGVTSWIAAFVFLLVRSIRLPDFHTFLLVLLLGVGFCGVNLLYLVFGVLSSATWLVLLLCSTAVLIAMLGQILRTSRYDIARAAAGHRRWRLEIVTLLICLVLAAGGEILVEAYHDRSRVLNGEPASFTLFGFPVTGWGAQRASFEWTTTSTAPVARRFAGQCLLYFGQSDGTAYFYRGDKRTHRGDVLHISTGSIIVYTGAGNGACQTR